MILSRIRHLLGQSPLVVKLAASLILPSLLSVAVVTAVLSSLYSARAREDLDRINALHLQGIRSQVEAAVSSSLKLAYLLKGDQPLLDSLGPSAEAVLAYSRATTQINQFLLSTPYVDSILLGHQNRIIYSLYQRDSYRETKEKMLAVLRGAPGPEPRVRLVVRANGDLGRVLTFVSNESNTADYIDAAAAVNLNLELLTKDLFGSPGPGNEGERSYALLNADGAVLADSHWLEDKGAVLQASDRQRIVESVAASGSFRTTDGPRNLIVSFVRSPVQDLSVVTLVDYGTYMSGIDGLWGQTMAFCAGVVVLLLGGALLIGTRLYLPLDGLLRRVQRLRRAPEPPGTVHDIAYASQVLSWTAERLDAGDSPGPEVLSGDEAALAKAGLTPEPGDSLLVAVARIDGADGGLGSLVPIAALGRNQLGARWPCAAFPWTDRDVVAVCRLPARSPLRPGVLEAVLRAWMHAVDRELGLSVSVGVGNLVTTPADLRACHTEATRRVRARVVLGGRNLILLEPPAGPAPEPFVLERCLGALEQQATSGDRTGAVQTIREFIAATEGRDVESRIDWFVDAAQTLYRVESRLGSHHRTPPDRSRLVRSVEDCWGLERVEAWLVGVYDLVRAAVEKVKNVRAPDLVLKAFAQLESRYADPLLSATLVAEQLSITPQYFSRIFNEHTGTSFPDHLKHLRLEKARALILEQPDLSLDEVCAATGFGNKTYFTTAFKQRFGVTPGKLRLAQRREGRESAS